MFPDRCALRSYVRQTADPLQRPKACERKRLRYFGPPLNGGALRIENAFPNYQNEALNTPPPDPPV